MGEDASVYLVHLASHRLTQNISLHKFRLDTTNKLRWKASQSLELVLPDDFDLILGSRNLSPELRHLTLTPCNAPRALKYDITESDERSTSQELPSTSSGNEDEIEVITRNGFITSLIGLPRFKSLRARVVNASGGFQLPSLGGNKERDEGLTTAVAGGTGICVFLSLSASFSLRSTLPSVLLWSIHIDDFGLVEYLLQHHYLDPARWRAIRIFLTRGGEGVDFTSFQTCDNASKKCEVLRAQVETRAAGRPVLSFHFRRMASEDLKVGHEQLPGRGETNGQEQCSSFILFCGSRSLEWQVKMWAMTMNPRGMVQTAYST